MKYKVGDKVQIKSLDWYNENRSKSHGTVACGGKYFDYDMKEWCGKTMTIFEVYQTCYLMEEDVLKHSWTDEMIEGLVEEEVFIKANDIYNEEYSKGEYCHEQSFKWGFQEGYNYSHENDKLEISLKEGYQFKDENGNVINARKIVLEKKEYPKTYEECCYVLGFENTELVFEDDYRDINPPKEQWKRLGLMNQLNKLLICRDAYWKIAGEEMGLGKPWEPDFDNLSTNLEYMKIVKGCFTYSSRVFAFPTAEMRDAFKKNFDPDIEICKEFL